MLNTSENYTIFLFRNEHILLNFYVQSRMFISGYLDSFHRRSVIRFCYLLLSSICFCSDYSEKHHKGYFFVLSVFNLFDIVDSKFKIKPFNINMSVLRMAFIILTGYYNVVRALISNNKIMQLYHMVYLVDVYLTFVYIRIENRKGIYLK